MSLSWLAIAMGSVYGALQVWGLARPQACEKALRAFPRSEIWGYVMMLSATAWFLWNIHGERTSDVAAFKPWLIGGFGAVGVGACLYLRDYLAVRGLAVGYLLLAKLMLDTARVVETDWRLVMVVWAYLLVVVGMWLTVSPYRLRDWLHWVTGAPGRMRVGFVVRLLFALGVVGLGLTVYRG